MPAGGGAMMAVGITVKPNPKLSARVPHPPWNLLTHQNRLQQSMRKSSFVPAAGAWSPRGQSKRVRERSEIIKSPHGFGRGSHGAVRADQPVKSAGCTPRTVICLSTCVNNRMKNIGSFRREAEAV
jgi:hypothetical protein